MSLLRSFAGRIGSGAVSLTQKTASSIAIGGSSLFRPRQQLQQQTASSGLQLQFVRYATKKAASSRTNDYNSKGKRLGLKAAEGSYVRVGQIIYRQRGTKWFPGENTIIGRDHTIIAKEPGFVRYYRDPFHPSRRFAGVALAPHLMLPSPHWQPRLRRFGRTPITDPELAEHEKQRLSRKEYFGWIEKTKQYEARKAKREAKSAEQASAPESAGASESASAPDATA
ncbi:ribosomal L27 protein-domain-containing protein [Myxozyma melibiosi]|uniref:Large ribosomal subunit protein bL27m n=1 Tax=Myxozyma melibiosi TaxID=54550 RepID=A0ABR1FAK6_9ASCO